MTSSLQSPSTLLAQLGIGVESEDLYRPLYERFVELDAKLVACGFPPTSPWWLSVLSNFYSSNKRQLVLRVGRRGGKSSTLCRIAVVEALYGQHIIPPGDLGIVGIVSISKPEAKKRLRTIKEILDKLHIRWKPLSEGDGIELLSRPIAFQVFAATLGGVVGGTWICGICDEVARWSDKDTGVNPANEVLASLRPTMATQRNAKIFLSSSALGTEDAHAKAFDDGETATQSVASAPTWVANPTVTEPHTHELEPNLRVWAREYGNKTQASLTSVFDHELIDRAFASGVEADVVGTEILVIDASRGGDAFAWGRVRWVWANGKRRLQLVSNGETPEVKEGEDFTASSVAYLASICKAHNITQVCGDQYEAGGLRTLFAQHDLSFWEHTWTNPSKRVAVDHLERWLRDSDLLLCESPKLRSQLRQYQERITRTGELTYGGSGPHDDYVQVLMTAAMAIDENRLEVPDPPKAPAPLHDTPEYWQERESEWERSAELAWEKRMREREGLE